MKHNLVFGLDIGSHTIKMGAARLNQESGMLEVLGIMEEESFGVRKGTVVHAEELAKRIANLKKRMEAAQETEIQGVYVNVGGAHLYGTPSHGIVAVSRADREISQEDVERALQAAQTFSLPRNKEILEVFPLQFSVDGEMGVKEVVGMKGVRLEVDVLAVCGFTPYVKKLTEAVLGADLEIEAMVPSPLTAAEAVLSPQQKELGVAILDVGAGSTNLAVFEQGDLAHISVIPVGSEHMTSDIAIGLKIDHGIAERIKIEYGGCIAQRTKKTERIALENGEDVVFSEATLLKILEARVREIFQHTSKELKKIGKDSKLSAGVVLVGGGVKLPGFVEFARRELKLSVRIGTPQGILTGSSDPRFFGVIGLMAGGAEDLAREMEGRPRPSEIAKSVKKFFKMFIP